MDKPLPGYGKVLMPEGRPKKKKTSTEKVKTEALLDKSLLFRYIIKAPLLLAGYFSGAFSALGGMNPIGIAVTAAFYGEGTIFYFMLLAVFAGYLRTGAFGVQMYTVALCFASLAKFFMFTEKKGYGIWQGAMGALCLVLGALVFSIMSGGSRFILVRGLIESVCVLGLSEIIRRSFRIWQGGLGKKILSQEELLCLSTVFVLGLCVLCVRGDMAFHAALLAGIVLLMALAYKAGTQAVALSTVLGVFFLLLGQGSRELFLMLAIGALLSGIFMGRRLFVVLGFWTGFIVPAFYLNTLPQGSGLAVLLLSGAVFLIIPKRWLNLINTYQNHKSEFDYSDYFVKLKELTEERLKRFSGVFSALAGTLEVVEVPTELSPSNANELVDQVSQRVCSGCEMSLFCWRAKNYETFEGIHRLIGAVEKKGTAAREDFTPWLKETCVLQKDILDTTNFYGQEYKNNLVWQNRLSQSRALVKDQLLCVEKILGSLSGFVLPQPVFYESMSKELRERLVKKGIAVSKVHVSSAGREGMSVSITKESCFANNQCKNVILFTVNNVLGKRFSLVKQGCVTDEEGQCQLLFREQKGYRLKTAVAAVTKEGSEKSGDTYYTDETEDKKGILALCDGMGTGEEAARESRKAVNLIKKFIHAGFPLELTMKTLNSVLALENKEMYTTMDVVSVDLYSGEAEIIKNGGSTVFVLKDGRIKTIRSESLPMGILSEWEGEVTQTTLSKGDFVVMVTDGITESFGIEGEKAAVVKAYETCEGNVDKFASAVLKLALAEYDGAARDDMTVMVSVMN